MPLAPLRRVSRCLHRHKCIRWTLWALLIPVLYAIIVVPVFFIYQGESNSHEVYVNRLPIMANMQRLEQRASRTNMTLTQLVANKDPLIEESNDFIDILFRATTADFRNKMLKMQVILTPVGSYSLENSTNMIGHSLSGVAANLNAGDDDIFNVTAHAFLATPVTVVLGNTVVKFPAGQPMESREIQLPFFLAIKANILSIVIRHRYTWRYIKSRPMPLLLGTAILFAMPNIRNSQPGIPSVGVSSDMLGYVWNIMLVTVFTAQIEAVPSMGAVTSFPPLIEPISAVDPPFQSKSQRSPK
ncbi:hypothetical protein BDF22DRAFT_745492 [Syncephalis plumigaleata]|nr:hypothetical protein BDF22DRAFT_745492 [Syncephalis plumigaleata]